jgi:hypothetical protein
VEVVEEEDQILKQILLLIMEDQEAAVDIILDLLEQEIGEMELINQQRLQFQHKDIMEEHRVVAEMVVLQVVVVLAVLELVPHHQTLVPQVVMD